MAISQDDTEDRQSRHKLPWNWIVPLGGVILLQFLTGVSIIAKLADQTQDNGNRITKIESMIFDQNIPRRVTDLETQIEKERADVSELGKSVGPILIRLGSLDTKLDFVVANLYGDHAKKRQPE